MKKTTAFKNVLKKLWQDESGQGATEYILLLVVIVGLAMVFRDKISETVSEKLDGLSGDIGGFSSGF